MDVSCTCSTHHSVIRRTNVLNDFLPSAQVRSLNAMFALLKRIVPVMPLGRKPSKVDMLRAAAEYIRLLSAVLQDPCVSVLTLTVQVQTGITHCKGVIISG